MAQNRPFGLVPMRNGGTTEFVGQVTMYCIPSTDGSAFYIGDPVKQAGGADANGVPKVAKAAAGDTLRGTVVGIVDPMINNPSLVGTVLDRTVVSIPATKAKDYYVLVCDDQNALFMIQGDATATNQTAVKAMYNADISVATPSAAYQPSATVIDSSTITTTNTRVLKLMGLAQLQAIPGGGSNTFGAYGIYAARINVHEFNGSVAGA